MPTTHTKRIILGLVAIVITLLSYFIFISIEHGRLAKIVISVAPEDSVVKMDGNAIHGGTIYVNPGSHIFVASRPDFKDDNSTVTTQRGKTTKVYLLPEPITAGALQFLKDNPKIQTEREGIASQKVAAIQAILLSKYPIIKYLPLITRYYTINYGASAKHPDDPYSIAIYISSDPANRDLALGWMKYKGFNPNNFEIIYKNS